MADDDETDTQTLVIGALTSQADLDRLLATRSSSVPLAVIRQRTDWNGLTREQEEERLRKHKHEEQMEAEYEREMYEIRERADRLIERLEEQKREVHRKLAEADARAIVLHDGRRVLVGEHGELIDQATNKNLEGKDKAEARSLQKEDSETVAERKALVDREDRLDEGVENAREAKDASQDRRNFSPEKIKAAQDKNDKAEAIVDDEETKKAEDQRDATRASTLTGADGLAALGLGESQNGRTVSFAGTLDAKDSRASALQNEFTTCVAGTDANDASQAACAASSDNASNKATLKPGQ